MKQVKKLKQVHFNLSNPKDAWLYEKSKQLNFSELSKDALIEKFKKEYLEKFGKNESV